jgi:hypothetical protein
LTAQIDEMKEVEAKRQLKCSISKLLKGLQSSHQCIPRSLQEARLRIRDGCFFEI